MSDNVIGWPGQRKRGSHLPVAHVVDEASKQPLRSIIVIGEEQDGRFYFATSEGNLGEVFWLMEMARKDLWRMSDG